MTMKRFLAILLTIMMLVQAMPLGALAEATVVSNVLEGAKYAEAEFYVADSVADNGAIVYGEDPITTQLVELGSAPIAPDIPDVDGYYTNGWSPDVTAAITSNSEVVQYKAQYSPIEYHTVTVNYVYEDNTAVRQSLVYDFDSSKEYDALEIPVEDITGFTVTAADEKGGAVVIDDGKFSVNVSNLAEDKTYTVKYIGAEVAYTVNHYYQEIDGTYGDPETTSKTGKAGTMTAATAQSETGFTAPADEDIVQKRISPKGDTVVDIYYTRNTYKLNFVTGSGGTYVENEVLPYGATITIPTVTRAGYTFDGWTEKIVYGENNSTTTEYTKDQTPLYDSTAEASIMPAGDVTLTAKWLDNTTATYKIVYWQQKVTDDKDAANTAKTYDFKEMVEVTDPVAVGTKGSELNIPKASDRYGIYYTLNTTNTNDGVASIDEEGLTEKTVAADGSTVFNVYYDRVEITYTFYKVSGRNYAKDFEYVGLYGQSLRKYNYSWPSEQLYYYENGNTDTTMSYLDAFIPPQTTVTSIDFYPTDSGSSTVAQYLQNLDGKTYPSTPASSVSTMSGGSFTFTNKFLGFEVSEYSTNRGATWNPIPSNKKINSYSTLWIRNERKTFTITHENCTDFANRDFLYEATLTKLTNDAGVEIVPGKPDGVDSDYVFGGWYYDSAFQKPVNWGTDTMPAANLIIYAKWEIPTKTVTYHYNDENDTVNVYTVYKYDTLSEHHYNTTDGSYLETAVAYTNLPGELADTETHTFEGWYTDEACTKPLVEDFANVKIAKNWDIYAKWVSTEEEEVVGSLVTVNEEVITEYVDEDGNTIQITEDMLPSTSGVIGATVTLEAPEIPGYVPVDKYVTYTITEDGDNKVKIVYTKLDTWTLTVKYQDEDGNELADPVKHANLTTDSKAVTYKVITGGTEQREIDGVKYDVKYMWQATDRILIADKPEANDEGVKETTLTFVYKKVSQVPYYIEHWVEGPVGSYSPKDTDGPLFQWKGYTVTASEADAKNYDSDNLAFNGDHEENVLSVTVVAGAVLKMYYDLQVADYTVEFYKQNDDFEWPDAPSETITHKDAKINSTVSLDATDNAKIAEITEADANGNSKYVRDTSAVGHDAEIVSGTVLADGSLKLKVYFKLVEYTVTYNEGEHGDLVGQNENGNVVHSKLYYGQTTPTAPAVTPEDGYHFVAWEPSIADTVTANVTYTATYAENGNVTIHYTVNNSAAGSVSKTEETLKPATGNAEGSTATANEGYKFVNWTLNGVEKTTAAKVEPAKGDVDGSTIWTERTYVANFERDFENYPFTVEPYEGVYDGAAHGVTVSGTIENDVVEYATSKDDNAEWSTTLPTYTDVGDDEYPVYVRVTNAGVTSGIVDSYVKITPIALTLNKEDSKEYNGAEQTIEITKSDITSDKLVTGETLTISGATITGKNVGEYTNVAEYTWSVTKADDTTDSTGNYTIEVTGKLTIIPYADEVIVNIVGDSNTTDYDGAEHSVSGYTASTENELYDVEGDDKFFTFSGTAAAARTDAGTTNMGLAASQFVNTNGNFAKVTFKVTDGYQKINPIDVTVTIVGNNTTHVYDGTEYTATGYTATASTELYDVEGDDKFFTFNGNDVAKRTVVGTTNMGLAAGQFANNNANFETVTFKVTDGYVTITPIDEVVVTITGRTSTVDYNGEEHSVNGYDVEISNPLYKETDFTFSGTAEAKRTDVGTTEMGLTKDQFVNNNANFKTVTFKVTDGYQKVEPIDVTVTIVGANNTTEYDGEEHTVTGYTATANTALYDVTKDFTFSGTAAASRTDAGTTNMGLKAEQFANTNGNFAKVTFKVTDGYQTITPIDVVVVTIIGNNNTTTYDSAEHTVTEYTVEISNPLYKEADFTFSGTASATRTVVGTTHMGLTAEQFTNTNANFETVTFNVTDGYQTITERELTITADSAEKNYDGTALIKNSYTSEGLAEGDEITSVTVTGSQTLVGSSKNIASDAVIKDGDTDVTANYAITYVAGILTVLEPTDDNKVVNKTHADKEDGSEYGLGEKVDFTIEVKNIYDEVKTITITELSGVTLIKDGVVVEGSKAIFEDVAPDAVVTLKAEYIIQEKDILEGVFVNKVKVEFSDEDKPYEDEDPVPTGDKNSHLTVTKETTNKKAEGETFALGETIEYKIVVTNDGNMTITDIKVTDKVDGYAAVEIGTIAVLKPGESKEFSFEHEVTEQDILAGKVVNNATATGKDPEDEDPTIVPGKEEDPTDDKNSHLTVVKETTNKKAEGETFALGETIEYKIVVTNDGNMTITDIKVTDKVEGYAAVEIGTIAVLKPGESKEFSFEHEVTEQDILAGKVVNVATATGEDPNGDEPEDIPGTTEDPTDEPDGHLTVTKTTTSTAKAEDGKYALGETITYEITVTNDGNVTINDITVTDDLTGESWEIETLAPGETSEVFTTSYDVTEKDILAGKVVNVATATGTGTDGNEPDVVPGEEEELTEEKKSHLTVVKETTSTAAENGEYALGEKITYKITVTNDGNMTITDIVVSDEVEGYEAVEIGTIAVLKPGESKEFSFEHEVTEQDILAGKVVNNATATGKDPEDEDPTIVPGKEEDPVEDLDTTLTVTKTSDMKDVVVKPDQVITYTITAVNEGNVSYKNLKVVDEISNNGEVVITNAVVTDADDAIVEGPVITIEGQIVKVDVLPVGTKVVITATHTVTAEDVQSEDKTIVNKVKVEADEIDDPDPEKPDPTPGGGAEVVDSVEPWKITIQANDNEKIYDGEYHGENGFTVVEGIQEGHTVSELTYVYAGGEELGRRDVNTEAENYVYAEEIQIVKESVKIVDATDADQTAKYDITLLPGNLQILPRQITVSTPDVVMYSGESIDMRLVEAFTKANTLDLAATDALDTDTISVSYNRDFEGGIFEGDGKKAYHPSEMFSTSLLGINQPGKLYVRDAKNSVTNADILSVDLADLCIVREDGTDVTANYLPTFETESGDLTVKTITLTVRYKLYDNGKTNKIISTDTPVKYLSVGDTFTKWCHNIDGYIALNQKTFEPEKGDRVTCDPIVAPEDGENMLILYYGLPLTHYTIRYIYLDGPEFNHEETIPAPAGKVISDIGDKIIQNTIDGYSHLRTEGLTLVVPADGSGVITVYYGEATTEEILTNIDELEVPTGASLGALNVGDCCE